MRIGIFLFLIFISDFLHSQKYDNTWIYGKNPAYQHLDYAGNGEIEFLPNGALRNEAKYRNQAFGSTIMCLSDKEGNFLAHSDGLWVLDTSNAIIENGDSINYGLWWEVCKPNQVQGVVSYSAFNGVFFLPVNDTFYMLIHTLADVNFDFTSFVNSRICYSILKVEENGNLKLEQKNSHLSEIAPSGTGCVGSVRHANGRDWWILFNEINTNCLHKYVLVEDSFQYIGFQCLGDTIYDENGVKIGFSPDGKRMSKFGTKSLDVYQFDRCSGDLTLEHQFKHDWTWDPGFNDSILWLTGSEFSPNSQLLYNVHFYNIIQYDLNDPLAYEHRDTVGYMDFFFGYCSGSLATIYFFQSQLAPDGKIYVGSWNSQRFYLTIDSPDVKGDSCRVHHRSVVLPKMQNLSMPYYPNYRLGSDPSSLCDTLVGLKEIDRAGGAQLKLYPNPGCNLVKADYNWIPWDRYEGVEISFVAIDGRELIRKKISHYSSVTEVSTELLSPGFYTIQLRGDGDLIITAKWIKE